MQGVARAGGGVADAARCTGNHELAPFQPETAAVINLVLGLSISFGTMVAHSGLSIDNMAHLGGFSSGLLFAATMVPRIGSPRDLFLFRLRMAMVLVVGILVLFGFYLAQLPR